MKKLLFLVASICLLSMCVPTIATAGVTGTPHAITARVCEACHIPHKAAQQDKLWARDTTGIGDAGYTAIGSLCWTCHSVGNASAGTADTPFNGGQNHKISSGEDCSGTGSACHDVHDNTNTKFMTVAKGAGTWCEACHGATPAAGAPGGDHTTTTGTQHTNDGGTLTCNQCHAPHGAASQTATTTYSDPILLGDNQMTGYWGSFCGTCHSGIIPTPFDIGTTTYGGVGPAVAKQHTYAEGNTGSSALKHPSTTTGGTTPIGGCNGCHEQHNAGGAGIKYILKTDNTDSQYCQSCHTQAGAPRIDQTLGGQAGGSHYTGSTHNPLLGDGALPWADDLDDDGNGGDGADWSTATADRMICETCHTVHDRAGVANGYFLREDYLAGGLCTTCHDN